MLDSISNIFSLPRNQNNKYKIQPSLQSHIKEHRLPSQVRRQLPPDPLFDSLQQNLTRPLQEWILHQEKNLKSLKVHKLIYQLVAQNSSRSKIQGPIRITVHNLFVLVVQYEVLSQFIKQMSMNQLQLFLDGSAGILLKNPDDPMEELTCVIHHVLTKCQIHRGEKGFAPITRSLNIEHIPNFLKIYGQLPQYLDNKFYDCVVRVIPMIVELLKLMARTNNQQSKICILDYLQWTHDIGNKLLILIERNIQETVQAGKPIEDHLCENSDNPELKKKLMQQASKIYNLAGFISAKELFVYACRQMYYFQHVFRLHKFIAQLTHSDSQKSLAHQISNTNLINNYLRLSINYDVNIPNIYYQCICKMVSLMILQYAEDVELIMPIKTYHFKESIQTIKDCILYQWQNRNKIEENMVINRPQFSIDKSQQSLLLYILRLIFSLQLDYIPVLVSLLKPLDKLFLHQAQLYLIKNGLLDFLIEEQLNLQGEDKKTCQQYFNTVALLLKHNTYASCVLDELLKKEYNKNQRCRFQEEIRKNFYAAKQYLLHSMADVVHVNSKFKNQQYFIPFPLELLLYPENSQSKHCVWISYIHDVIIRQLNSQRQKLIKIGKFDTGIEQDINDWVTLAILFQVQYLLRKNGQDIELGQFTLNYLTPILKEAIKWKHQSETAAMQRILKSYQQWELYYTEIILNKENNEDVIEVQFGSTVNFLFLKRWNRKISNTIQLFIDSVQNTVVDPNAPLY